MFDPSKLDLDLDNLDKKQEEAKNSSSAQDISKNQQNDNNNSGFNKESEIILDEKKENKSILESFDNPLLGEEKKDSEITNNNSENTEKKSNQEKKIEPKDKLEEKIEPKDELEKKYTESKPESKINTEKKEENIIFDINLNSKEILLTYLISNEYDFFTIEPEENKVKINFFKNKTLKETKYIKYPVYSQILIKLKSLSKLKIDETEKNQEGTGEILLSGKSYKVLTKTVPSPFGEKIFTKAVEIQKKVVKKQAKKASVASIFGFLGAIIFIALTLGGAFISFVVMNAKTVEDVQFFFRLGINLNDINNFIETAIGIIFSIIVLLEVLALIIFLFKFLFTKKEFKKQRITRGVISFLILLITFITVSGWMFIDRKIKALPNWQELAYGNIQILDNDLLKKSETFSREAAILKKTTNLIGPIEIKFDLTNFAKNETDKGIKINKYKWIFGGEEEIITLEPTIIHNFNEKGTTSVELTLEEVDLHGDIVDKKVENIQSIEIANIIDIKEEKLDNGGKVLKFDASDLRNLGKVDWFFITKDQTGNLKSVYTGYNFNPAKVIFEDTIIGLQIQKEDRENDNLDKIFVIEATKQNDIKGVIEDTQDPLNDLKYTFKVSNINSDFGNGFIEEFKWKIDNIKTKTLKSDIDNIEKSSEFKIIFKKYGKHTIIVDLKDSTGNIKTIEKIIDIKKSIRLKETLSFFNENELIEGIRYKESTHEYIIKDLKIPTTLEINAKDVESEDDLDYLEKVEWDIGGNGDIDEEGKILNYNIEKGGSYKIDVIYTFKNKRIKTEKRTKLKETIYIDSEKKEIILDLKISKPRDYTPVKVSFDASSSYIKGKDISKFIYDYGDGTKPDSRDAKNPGHRYIKPGDYTVKLTVITTDGKEYSIKKKLILKPQPQKAEISVSMLKVPTYTTIDFSSAKSTGEINTHFWDFGDGTTSTTGNPSHMYKKAGKYKVKLILDYRNKNTLTDEKEIIVYEE